MSLESKLLDAAGFSMGAASGKNMRREALALTGNCLGSSPLRRRPSPPHFQSGAALILARSEPRLNPNSGVGEHAHPERCLASSILAGWNEGRVAPGSGACGFVSLRARQRQVLPSWEFPTPTCYERLSALRTALIEASSLLVSTLAPQRVRPPRKKRTWARTRFGRPSPAFSHTREILFYWLSAAR